MGFDPERLDWARLQRMREGFLVADGHGSDYWAHAADLEAYDATFAARIGWKWDALLEELTLRAWAPPECPVIDWGCGTGVAVRRLRAHFPHTLDQPVFLHDRSLKAAEFARTRLLNAHPQGPVHIAGGRDLPDIIDGALLLVSHVLNELNAADEEQLRALAAKARAVIWVESGTHTVSRRLINIRESLRADFTVIAPCTHGRACGMLAEGNQGHWCHHFARAPVEAFTESHWAAFSQIMGIDLRSLPYACLVLSRDPPTPPLPGPEWARLIGRPREYKGYMRALSCEADGLHEYRLQKRTDKALHKALHKGKDTPLYRWRTDGEDILGAETLD